MHPYEMLQTLRDRHEDIAVPVSIGSVYHAVSRLADRGYVRALQVEQVGHRPERTTYEILDAGRIALQTRISELVATPTALSAADAAGLGELSGLEPDEAARALDSRLAAIDAALATYESLLADAHERKVPEIYLLYGSYATAQQRLERDWVAALRDRIQNGELPWPTHE